MGTFHGLEISIIFFVISSNSQLSWVLSFKQAGFHKQDKHSLNYLESHVMQNKGKYDIKEYLTSIRDKLEDATGASTHKA